MTNLSTPSGVLSGTAGDELGIVLFDQLGVDVQVLGWIGEDSIVGLELVLVEDLLVTIL